MNVARCWASVGRACQGNHQKEPETSRFLRVQAGFRVAEKFLAFLLHDDW